MKKGDKIKVHYTGTLDDGTQFDSSEGKEPLEFVFGEGQVIPGFENAMKDMKIGEDKHIKIKAKDAYGEINQELIRPVPRDMFPPDLDIKIGARLVLKAPTGEHYQVHVMEVDDNQVTLDLNHPLAGKNLNFKVKIISVN